jgi:hypothetical protein
MACRFAVTVAQRVECANQLAIAEGGRQVSVDRCRACNHYQRACRHLGDQLRTIETPGCACGSKVATVFGCAIHGECVLHRIPAHLFTGAICVGCEQFADTGEPTNPEPQS